MADLTIHQNEWAVVTAKMTLFGQEVQNRFVYKNIAAPDMSTSHFGTTFVTITLDPLFDILSNEINLYKIRVVRHDNVGVPTEAVEYDVNRSGSIVENALPPSVAVVMKRRAAGVGRRNRGRIYVAGIPEVDHNDGQLLLTPYATYVAASALLASPLAVQFEPHLATFDAGGSITSSRAVISTSADRVLRNQRRRQIGVGI